MISWWIILVKSMKLFKLFHITFKYLRPIHRIVSLFLRPIDRWLFYTVCLYFNLIKNISFMLAMIRSLQRGGIKLSYANRHIIMIVTELLTYSLHIPLVLLKDLLGSVWFLEVYVFISKCKLEVRLGHRNHTFLVLVFLRLGWLANPFLNLIHLNIVNDILKIYNN